MLYSMPEIIETPVPVATPPWKDILIRAAKTFIQGGSGAVGGLFFISEVLKPEGFDLQPLVIWASGVGIGGLSAVLSWAWNSAVSWANS